MKTHTFTYSASGFSEIFPDLQDSMLQDDFVKQMYTSEGVENNYQVDSAVRVQILQNALTYACTYASRVYNEIISIEPVNYDGVTFDVAVTVTEKFFTDALKRIRRKRYPYTGNSFYELTECFLHILFEETASEIKQQVFAYYFRGVNTSNEIFK